MGARAGLQHIHQFPKVLDSPAAARRGWVIKTGWDKLSPMKERRQEGAGRQRTCPSHLSTGHSEMQSFYRTSPEVAHGTGCVSVRLWPFCNMHHLAFPFSPFLPHFPPSLLPSFLLPWAFQPIKHQCIHFLLDSIARWRELLPKSVTPGVTL